MWHVPRILPACVLLLGARGAAPLLRREESDGVPDEEMLRRAGVKTTDDGLLAFLRQHSAQDADLKDLDKLIRQLASENFEEREQASARLTALGPLALKELRRHLSDDDAETARR